MGLKNVEVMILFVCIIGEVEVVIDLFVKFGLCCGE